MTKKLSIARRLLRRFGYDLYRPARGEVHPRGAAIRLDYPLHPEPRYGYGKPVHPQIEAALRRGEADYRALLESFAPYRAELAEIPREKPGGGPSAHWGNAYFSSLDAAALYCLLAVRKPALYLEIGSGNSTLFARRAVARRSPGTRVVSIDPQPRAGVDALCDEIVRAPLERADLAVFERVRPGDIVFFDGSHRVFTNSDVVVFFLEVLPRLPAGVLCHIHDIVWPDDYPPEWTGRHYSEQYLLGASLLAAPPFHVVLPVHFACADPGLRDLARLVVPSPVGLFGVSFWFEKSDGPQCGTCPRTTTEPGRPERFVRG